MLTVPWCRLESCNATTGGRWPPWRRQPGIRGTLSGATLDPTMLAPTPRTQR